MNRVNSFDLTPSRSLDVTRFNPGALSLLAPPYQTLVAWIQTSASCATLGTIVHATGPSALGVLGSVALALRSCPWLVPVVTFPVDEGHLEPLIDLVGELRDRVAILRANATTRPGIAAALISAVRHRSTPRPELLSSYTVARLAAPDLEEALTEQFSKALEPAELPCRSVATYSRLFARHGPYTARDWRALARLACYQCVQQPGALIKPEVLVHLRRAHGPTLDRTAENYARNFLGMSLKKAGERVGWEWVFEHAFRRSGYVFIGKDLPENRMEHARPERCKSATLRKLHH